MAVWSEVKYSYLNFASRIDGEYFSPNYLLNEQLIRKLDTKPLPFAFSVSDGNHLEVSQAFTEKINGIPYFRGKDINDFFLENASPIRIPFSVFNTQQMQRSHFKANDVLLSIVGTIGSVSIVPETIGLATGSCKIAILREKGFINPHFLAAFLLSKYGKFQIERNTRGAVQMGLILKDLVHIRIPIISKADEEEIAKLVSNAISANQKSKKLYIEAQETLEQELGLDKLNFEKPVGYEASFSEAMLSLRTDAEYFQPKYLKLIRTLLKRSESNGVNPYKVKEILKTSPKYGTSTKLKYLNEGVAFLRIADLSDLKFEKDNLKYISWKDAILEKAAQVKTDDILISRSGTLGLTICIPNELDGSVFGSYFIKLQLNGTINPLYFSFYMNSLAGKMQVERYNTGGIQTNLTIPAIESFLIVPLKRKKENQILELIKKSEDFLKESKQLLEKAKQMVEDLIEQAARET